MNIAVGRLLFLIRHGESEFNAQNRFTGWADPPLTRRGIDEAEAAAARLVAAAVPIRSVFSSTLLRARRTAQIIQAALPGPITLSEDGALNERNYGELTGLDKAAAIKRWGAEQIRNWRRSYSEPPPGGESLKETAGRVLSYYVQSILPSVMRELPTLVVAHGNSLRALIMTLDRLEPATVESLELATGEIRAYRLHEDTSVQERSILEI